MLFRVRSKYFERILACFAQAHIKVLFSDDQGRTIILEFRMSKNGNRPNFLVMFEWLYATNRMLKDFFTSITPRIRRKLVNDDW